MVGKATNIHANIQWGGRIGLIGRLQDIRFPSKMLKGSNSQVHAIHSQVSSQMKNVEFIPGTTRSCILLNHPFQNLADMLDTDDGSVFVGPKICLLALSGGYKMQKGVVGIFGSQRCLWSQNNARS